jgi:protein kinase C substrate 80K-H
VTLALPGFYCKNKGHIPGYVPHLYVNDGVCDYEGCCDGSDEWAGVGGVKCPDRCQELGQEWRRLDELRQKAARAALKKKAELVQEAARLRAGVETNIKGLEDEIRALEAQEAELERKYQELERKERGKVVTSKGKGSKVTVLAGLAKQRVEELRNALISVTGKRDALKERVKELEAILSAFKEEYNPNFNDEGVKRAVKSWEDYAANKVETDDSAEERDIQEIAKPDSESEGINWAEWETEAEESDTDASEYSLLYATSITYILQSTSSRSTSQVLCANGSTKSSPTSVSCLSRMASLQTTQIQAASPKLSQMPATPTRPSLTISRKRGLL